LVRTAFVAAGEDDVLHVRERRHNLFDVQLRKRKWLSGFGREWTLPNKNGSRSVKVVGSSSIERS
jgi:hypothetical protein